MEDTIAAIATACGEGGIGVVRLSGEGSFSVLNRIFSPGKRGASEQRVDPFADRKLVYGFVTDPKTEEIVDEALAVYMKAPGTYTREDVVEIHCHGSAISLKKTLELALLNGARLAEPGEFTKRAFLNGRLDLSQAESVMDLISAKTDKGYKQALGQLEGRLSERVSVLREELLELLAHLAVSLDFPEEDVEELTVDMAKTALVTNKAGILELLRTAETGRILREGLKVAIMGKPNVGKSSLLNALLRESRAIVTSIPGTTRDTIEEQLSLGGIPLCLIDTAGIRDTEDPIENIGIQKSREAAEKADLILFLLDAQRPLEQEDRDIAAALNGKNVFLLLNKVDRGCVLEEEEAKALLPGAFFLKTAVTEGLGLPELEEQILCRVYGGSLKAGENPLVSNARHKALLQQAAEEESAALALLDAGEALDLVEMSVRQSWSILGEIIGDTVTEDIIDQVFSRFCLGK